MSKAKWQFSFLVLELQARDADKSKIFMTCPVYNKFSAQKKKNLQENLGESLSLGSA